MARILAIDYGVKRCGIAVTDELQISANGLDTLPTNELMEFLKKYFSKEQVEQVVIGEPKDLRGNETHGTKPVQQFIEKFKTIFPQIPITGVDERFTSKMATQTILMSGAKKSQRQDKSLVDKVSAIIILQYYLEMKK